jgi:putative chitinase
MITLEQLLDVVPHAKPGVEKFVDPLNSAMKEFAIDTAKREAQFIAQIAHESAGFSHMREMWGPTPEQLRYEPPSVKAQDLGNSEPGDGFRFRGRGLIQITGRANYRECGAALGLPLEDEPDRLEQPVAACRSAAWFWRVGAGLRLGHAAHAHGIQDGCDLNDLADAGDFEGITLAINGGLNGLAERVAYYGRARETLA